MTLFEKTKNLLLQILIVLQILGFCGVYSTPMNNIQDSCPVYNPQGTDKYYKKLAKPMLFSWDISPYYQSANGVRNRNGNKVPVGELYGSINNTATGATTTTYGNSWNMLAPFFDMSSMTPNQFTAINYPNLYSTYSALSSIDGINCTKQANYKPDDTSGTNPSRSNSTIFQVTGKYEKIGVRGKFDFQTKLGLGLSVKTGFADYKIRPNFVQPAPASGGADLLLQLYNLLLQESSRNNIFKELNLGVNEVRNTEMEDTHLQLSWQIPFHLKEENEIVATIAPWLAVGCWAPTGNTKDYNRAFDLSTGNNGHTGVTAECAINLDFTGTIQISTGGGVLWLQDKNFDNFRLPSNQYQTGFYPWTTSVNVDPGMTWYLNLSFKAENFVPHIEGFSFFFDFVYSYHEHDKYTVNDRSSIRESYFDPALKYIKETSSWKSQLLNFGFNYQPTNHLLLGFLVQAPVSGIKVYRSVTTMGTVTFTF